ncbi:MAG: FAD-dependent oxidoreductase [Coleofasciculus sp. C2-GNP5-27]
MNTKQETKLAKDAGLDIGDRGGIRVNEQMRTNDDHIWAVGDAVEVRDWVTGEWILIPLAGPANRQGRVAADAICGRDTTFRGVQGTTVCGVFGLIVAATGASEKTLKRVGMAYEKVYLHPGHHVGYYPGAKPINMKLSYHAFKLGISSEQDARTTRIAPLLILRLLERWSGSASHEIGRKTRHQPKSCQLAGGR